MGRILALTQTVVNLFYPSRCCICGEYGEKLCSKCVITEFKRIRKPYSFQGFNACASYGHFEFRQLLILLKHTPSMHASTACARLLMVRLLCGLLFFKHEPIFIVPLPRSQKNIQKFGHDQTILIAKAFQNILTTNGWNAVVLSRALKNTKDALQHNLKTRKERRDSAKDKFILKQKPPHTGIIILLDDIITSGATMESALNLLQKHGYTNIVCASVLIKDS